jgi:GNAT superfamily N-acetyltransferase
MKQITQISVEETIIVRHPVLRKGMPIETCQFDGDDLTTTIHFGFFENNLLIGVISLFKQKNGTFIDKEQFQIRGMAVLENHQKKGIGQALINHCENYVLSKKNSLIWFNARVNAVPFYEKMGYCKVGVPFDIEPIGTHFLMTKSCI